MTRRRGLVFAMGCVLAMGTLSSIGRAAPAAAAAGHTQSGGTPVLPHHATTTGTSTRSQVGFVTTGGGRHGILRHTLLGAAAPARVATGTAPRIAVTPTAFAGAQNSSTPSLQIAPPDTNIAVGNGLVIETVNSTIYEYNEAGTLLNSQDLATFFGATTYPDETDARVIYDAETGHWLVSALLIDLSGAHGCAGSVVLAASTGTDPNPADGTKWNLYTAHTATDDLTDQPRLGLSHDKITLSWDDFINTTNTDFNQCGYDGVGGSLYVMDKAAVESGSAATASAVIDRDLNYFDIVGSTPQLAAGSTTYGSTAYAFYNNSADFAMVPSLVNTVGVIAIDGTPGSLTWNESDPSFTGTSFPNAVNQPGGAGTLDPDDRFLGSVVQGTDAWITANDKCGTTTCARFIEVGLSGVNGSSGSATVRKNFDAPTSGEIYPAASFDSNHDMFAVTTHSSSLVNPSVDEWFLNAAAAPSAIQRTVLRTGAGQFQFISQPYRWGDYSGAAIDPDVPGQVWLGGEYTPVAGQTAIWGTWIAPVYQTAGYTLDGYGGIHAYGEAVPVTAPGAYWSGQDIARGLALRSDGQSGFLLDECGGIHPFASAYVTRPATPSTPWYACSNGLWNIARSIALASNGTSGYVLDGWGGIHPFGGAKPVVAPNAYWSGWDIAKSIVLVSDSSGYLLDGYGGVHPFHALDNSTTLPPNVSSTYWGWNIARGIVVRSDLHTGYVLDGWGGVHPWAQTGFIKPAVPSGGPYWSGQDIAKGLVLESDTTAELLDAYGGVHPLGPTPSDWISGYWSGWNIARAIV